MMGMKNNQIYIAVGIIVVILVLAIWSNKSSVEAPSKIDETSTSTPATIQGSNNSSTSMSPKPVSTPTSAGASSPVTTSQTTEVSAPNVLPVAELDGSFFRMTSYNGLALPSDERYILSFDNGYLSVNFCNSMSGWYVYDGNTIKANNLASTQKFCSTPSNLMEIETNFVSMLNHGALIYQTGNTITIVRTGVATMTFVSF